MEVRLKIVAGMGNIDDYIPYVKAGADEVFLGYVPLKWTLDYGIASPLNRREAVFYDVQAGSFSELKILKCMRQQYNVPIAITFNSLYYAPYQYEEILNIIKKCMSQGFDTFIVADPGLLIYIKAFAIKNIKLHISGEFAEMNSLAAAEFCTGNVTRIIFHRKTTVKNMKRCIDNEKKRIAGAREFEAFVLNEKCDYTGAFCNTFHCDEFAHMCRIPYIGEKKVYSGRRYIPGTGGCGLCALWDLNEAGVTHVKLVSRGEVKTNTVRDIRALRQAVDLIKEAKDRSEYINLIKQKIFNNDCSKNCYYLEGE